MREAPLQDLARDAQIAGPRDDKGGVQIVGDRYDPLPDGPVEIDVLAMVAPNAYGSSPVGHR